MLMVRSVIVVFVIFVVIHSQLTKKTSNNPTMLRWRNCQRPATIRMVVYTYKVFMMVYGYKTQVPELEKKEFLVRIPLIWVILVMMGWDISIVRIIPCLLSLNLVLHTFHFTMLSFYSRFHPL